MDASRIRYGHEAANHVSGFRNQVSVNSQAESPTGKPSGVRIVSDRAKRVPPSEGGARAGMMMSLRDRLELFRQRFARCQAPVVRVAEILEQWQYDKTGNCLRSETLIATRGMAGRRSRYRSGYGSSGRRLEWRLGGSSRRCSDWRGHRFWCRWYSWLL